MLCKPILYNFFLWVLYTVLLHEKLAPKYGKVGLYLMIVWDFIASAIGMYYGFNKILQQTILLIPLFIMVSFLYFERIQWRMVVMSLGCILYMIPELLVESVIYFIYEENPFQYIRQNPIHVLSVYILAIVVFFFLRNILDKIYKSRVTQKGKVAIIMTLSVILIAFMPITYFFDHVHPYVLYSFLVLGIVLDVVLIVYILRYIQIRKLEHIQHDIQKDNRMDQAEENEQLRELRHDISNYMNALKILQKQKEGNEI